MSDTPDLDLRASVVDSSDQLTLPTSTEVQLGTAIRSPLRRIPWLKIGTFSISLFLFILALTFMKEGARSLVPLIRSQLAVTNPANGLGFGWRFDDNEIFVRHIFYLTIFF